MSTSTVIIFLLNVIQLQAQQLYCGSNPISFNVSGGTCSSPLGIGGQNTSSGNDTYALTISHWSNGGGGLYVNNTSNSASAKGIRIAISNGIGLYTDSNTGKGLLAVSTSGSALYGETATGKALYAKATAPAGWAGYFEGNVEVTGDLEITALTADVATTANLSAASFKSGTDRQLFVVPNLGTGGFNYLSQPGDHGIFFSDGLGSGGQNLSAGLVIGPWKGGHTGIRVNSDGKVGIGVAQPQHALDVDGEGLISQQLSVPKVMGEQNGSSPMSLCGNTASSDGACINFFGNGHPTSPGLLSLIASNGVGVKGGEIRFMQNTGPGTFVQNMVVTADGEVGIGIDDPTAALHVKGSIKLADANDENQFEVSEAGVVHCREITVDAAYIPDYVFDPAYQLMPLSDLRNFVREQRHLPGIKSEQTYKEEGQIEIAELSLKLLEKVEELTLYTLELEAKIRELEDKVDSKQ